MTSQSKHIGIVGAGLVGSLLSIYLAKRGYRVSVFEKRSDMRVEFTGAGKSINLALSNRGINALQEVGLSHEINKYAIPMHGRMMHDVKGDLTFLPYGKQGQFINSISRADLNVVLLNAAEKAGVEFYFGHRCTSVDFTKTEILFQELGANKSINKQFDIIIGTDGAYSAVRTSLQVSDRFSFSQSYIDHGYKEFHIPAGSDGNFVLEKNALHIWPRESFMMIALPNPDGSFTGTLFFPWEGSPSFQSLKTDEEITSFFKKTFPDIVNLIPELLSDFKANPASSLATMKCWPWVKNKVLLLGDAAHAIVPFYGQGMNAGFEDCSVLNKLLDQLSDDWEAVLTEFQKIRKPDTDAIAQLALDNFIEMRDLVADADFLLRKKIEAKLHALFPEKWIPLYSMVTFYETIRYADALATGMKQKAIMNEVMKSPDLANTWESLDFNAIVQQL